MPLTKYRARAHMKCVTVCDDHGDHGDDGYDDAHALKKQKTIQIEVLVYSMSTFE